MKKVILFISIIILFAACEKDDDNGNGLPVKYLPVNIYIKSESPNSYEEITLEYDSLDRITAIDIVKENLEVISSERSYISQKIAYNPEGKIDKIINYSGQSAPPANPEEWFTDAQEEYRNTHRYHYLEEDIFSSSLKGGNGFFMETDEKGFILGATLMAYSATQAFSVNTSSNFYTNTYLYDEKGNIIRELKRWVGNIDYSYDDKNGIFKNVNIPQWLLSKDFGLAIDGIHNYKNNFIQSFNEKDETTWKIEIKYINDFPSLIKAAHITPQNKFPTFYEIDIIYK